MIFIPSSVGDKMFYKDKKQFFQFNEIDFPSNWMPLSTALHYYSLNYLPIWTISGHRIRLPRFLSLSGRTQLFHVSPQLPVCSNYTFLVLSPRTPPPRGARLPEPHQSVSFPREFAAMCGTVALRGAAHAGPSAPAPHWSLHRSVWRPLAAPAQPPWYWLTHRQVPGSRGGGGGEPGWRCKGKGRKDIF